MVEPSNLEAVLATRLPDGSFPATVAQKGQDFRRWERISLETNRFGIKIRTNAWIELATGLHYPDPNSGEWVQSAPEIVITNTGPYGAMGKGAPHEARFSANINSTVGVEVLTPDNQQLKTRILGMAYEDFHARTNVLIAELKDADGQIVGTNQVLYPDAFTDFHADVRYTHTQSGVEQDIILRQRPPLPEQFGLNPAYTRLLLLTEFIDPPTNIVRVQRVRRGWIKAKVDKAIRFGAMTIGQGTAFKLGDDGAPRTGIPVEKRWEVLEGRTFLIEEINWHRLVPLLSGLQASVQPRTERSMFASAPKSGESGPNRSSQLSGTNSSLRGLRFPPRPVTSPGSKATFAFQPAPKLSVQPATEHGVVVDFDLQDATDMVLKADTTYVVGANMSVNLSGTSVIEGGCVVKFRRGGSISIADTLLCETGPYRPAFLTAVDDNSVGTTISGSTGNPTGTYANSALVLGTGGDLKYLNIRYAKEAICCDDADFSVSHSQILFCDYGFHIDTTSFTNLNLLMYQVGTNYFGVGFNGRAEHFTSDQANVLALDPQFNYDTWCGGNPSSSLLLVNSLTASVTNLYALPATYTDRVRSFSTGSGVFQTVGAAAHYLVDGSTNRDCGTMNISPELAGALRAKTTYPPIVISSATITTDTNLTLQTQRDTDVPDLGYHYDPVDYALYFARVSNATVQVQAGTVLSTAGQYGLALRGGASLSCQGAPNNPVRIARCNLVQEPSNPNWNAKGRSVLGTGWDEAPTYVTCRFTEWTMPAQDAEQFRSDYSATTSFVDCEFHGGGFEVGMPSLFVTNCLFERVSTVLDDQGGDVALSPLFRNCLFFGGQLTLNHANTADGWLFRDNVFDRATITQNGEGPLDHGYDGYTTGSVHLPGSSLGYDVVTDVAWQTGPLGAFYLPLGSALIDHGSRTAPAAGLFHYTTSTNQQKEGVSAVDIGHHYIALTSDDKPIDTDSDGLADYVEDANGDGVYSTNDLADWNSPDTDGDGVSDSDEVLNHTDPRAPNPAVPSSVTLQPCPQ